MAIEVIEEPADFFPFNLAGGAGHFHFGAADTAFPQISSP
jgi:hypothetical protein